MPPKKTSEFSATMIGIHGNTNNKDDFAKKAYKEEANSIASYLTGVHHARKLPAMQLNYPDTVNKLSKNQAHIPVVVQPPAAADPPRHSKNHASEVLKQDQFLNKMKTDMKNEIFINDRKRRYNFSLGQKASVKQVFEGTAPMPQHVLFPQKATHLQVLALTGTLKMPAADKLPAEVPRGKRWLGDSVGWES